MVTSSRLRYQDLRGLMRSFSLDLPVSRSQVHLTSLALKGLPSCQVTPWRSGNVSSVPSSLQDQLVARSGTTELRLFCFTCWSNNTRLLKTPIIGRSAKTVASSRIDMLAGLSTVYIFRMPPCFWANAPLAAHIAISNPPVTTKQRMCCFISVSLPLLIARCPFPSRSILGVSRGRALLFQAHLLGSRSRCRHLEVYQR